MIGLKRGSIELWDYCSEWPQSYECEKENLISLIGSRILQIEHIGSTSIPGIKAKPLIDILIKVKSPNDVEYMVKPLESQGYTYFGDLSFISIYTYSILQAGF